MNSKEYLTHVGEAVDRARRRTHGVTTNQFAMAEELLAQLAARNLIVVEVPAGVSHDYRGVPSLELDG